MKLCDHFHITPNTVQGPRPIVPPPTSSALILAPVPVSGPVPLGVNTPLRRRHNYVIQIQLDLSRKKLYQVSLINLITNS